MGTGHSPARAPSARTSAQRIDDSRRGVGPYARHGQQVTNAELRELAQAGHMCRQRLGASPLVVGTGIPVIVGGNGRPLADFQVLDPVETGNIQMRVADFNTIIDTVCTNRNIPVVDIATRLDQVLANGFTFRNETFTTDYVVGGIFSVDGVHPSSIGYYIVALEFIKVINASFGASIPDPPFPVGPLMARVPPSELKRFSPLEYALALPSGALDGLLRSPGVDPASVRGQ